MSQTLDNVLVPPAFFEGGRIEEFVPRTRLAWSGEAEGLHGYHTWQLLPRDHACHVVTEETVKGPGAASMREKDPNGMHKGHDLWLAELAKGTKR